MAKRTHLARAVATHHKSRHPEMLVTVDASDPRSKMGRRIDNLAEQHDDLRANGPPLLQLDWQNQMAGRQNQSRGQDFGDVAHSKGR